MTNQERRKNLAEWMGWFNVEKVKDEIYPGCSHFDRIIGSAPVTHWGSQPKRTIPDPENNLADAMACVEKLVNENSIEVEINIDDSGYYVVIHDYGKYLFTKEDTKLSPAITAAVWAYVQEGK